MHSRYELQDKEIEKIVALIEREAGRDAPLSKADAEATSKLIEIEAVASEFAASIREINEHLDRLFNDLTKVEKPEYMVKILTFLRTIRMNRESRVPTAAKAHAIFADPGRQSGDPEECGRR